MMLMELLFLLLSGFLAFSKVYFFFIVLLCMCMYIHMTKSPVLNSPTPRRSTGAVLSIYMFCSFFGIGCGCVLVPETKKKQKNLFPSLSLSLSHIFPLNSFLSFLVHFGGL